MTEENRQKGDLIDRDRDGHRDRRIQRGLQRKTEFVLTFPPTVYSPEARLIPLPGIESRTPALGKELEDELLLFIGEYKLSPKILGGG